MKNLKTHIMLSLLMVSSLFASFSRADISDSEATQTEIERLENALSEAKIQLAEAQNILNFQVKYQCSTASVRTGQVTTQDLTLRLDATSRIASDVGPAEDMFGVGSLSYVFTLSRAAQVIEGDGGFRSYPRKGLFPVILTVKQVNPYEYLEQATRSGGELQFNSLDTFTAAYYFPEPPAQFEILDTKSSGLVGDQIKTICTKK